MWHKDIDGKREAEKCRFRLTSFCTGAGLDIGARDEKISPNALSVGETEICDIKCNLHDTDALAFLGDNYFDYVFSSHCLEEFSTPETVLAEWWSKIKPGGYIILYCDDPDFTPKVDTTYCRIAKKVDLQWKDVWAMFEQFGSAEKISATCHNEFNEYSWQLIVQKKYGFVGTPAQKLRATRQWGRIVFPRKKVTDKEALVIRYGAFGDTIWATPVLRELKKQGYYIVYNTSDVPAQVVRENPNIDEFLIQEGEGVPHKECEAYWDYIGKSFEKVVNLCGVVEDKLLRVEERTGYDWPWEKRHKRCNKNYIDALMESAGLNKKGEMPELFFTEEEELAAQTYMGQMENRFTILWSLSGSSFHKIYPWAEQVGTALTHQYKDIEIITVGDDMCRIMEWQAPNTQNKSGQFTIRQSMLLTKYVNLVIGPETGILNAASCYDTPKIVFLSHSSEENLTKHWKNCQSLHPDTCECHPCHQLHYSKSCPLGNVKGKAARCAEHLSPNIVIDAIRKVYHNWKYNQPDKKWAGFSIADSEITHRLAKRVEGSFKYYHPDIPFFIFDAKDEKELLGEIKDPGPYLASVSMRPRVCDKLLDEYDGVIYLDVDTVVAARLDEFLEGDYEVAASLNVKGFGREALYNDGVFALTNKGFAEAWTKTVYDKHTGYSNDQLAFNWLTNLGFYDVKVVDETGAYYNECSREYWGKITVRDGSFRRRLFCNNRQLKVLHWAGGFGAMEDKISCGKFSDAVRGFLNKVTGTTDFTDVKGKDCWWPTNTATTPIKVAARGLKVTFRKPFYEQQPGDANVFNEIICRDEYRLTQLGRIINPKVILDLGGHVGTFGLMAKKIWPDAFLIAVEANEQSCNLYKRNMIDNGFTHYEILNRGVAYNPKATCLVEDFRATGGGILAAKEDVPWVSGQSEGTRSLAYAEIKTITIEDIIKMFNLPSLDLVKWDIEGSEIDCWEHMTDESAAKIKYMIGEFHVVNRWRGDFKATPIEKGEFWELAQSKFPHLEFNHYAELIDMVPTKGTYMRRSLGIFEAAPKGEILAQTKEDFFT